MSPFCRDTGTARQDSHPVQGFYPWIGDILGWIRHHPSNQDQVGQAAGAQGLAGHRGGVSPEGRNDEGWQWDEDPAPCLLPSISGAQVLREAFGDFSSLLCSHDLLRDLLAFFLV